MLGPGPFVPMHAEVEDPADVGVGDPPREEHLAAEPRRHLFAHRAFAVQELERHRRAELLVLGLVDLPHRARTEPVHDPVPAGDQLASSQLTVLGPLRRHLGSSDPRIPDVEAYPSSGQWPPSGPE